MFLRYLYCLKDEDAVGLVPVRKLMRQNCTYPYLVFARLLMRGGCGGSNLDPASNA
jgi:hypothetical protein